MNPSDKYRATYRNSRKEYRQWQAEIVASGDLAQYAAQQVNYWYERAKLYRLMTWQAMEIERLRDEVDDLHFSIENMGY
jgi:hypothetical protein